MVQPFRSVLKAPLATRWLGKIFKPEWRSLHRSCGALDRGADLVHHSTDVAEPGSAAPRQTLPEPGFAADLTGLTGTVVAAAARNRQRFLLPLPSPLPFLYGGTVGTAELLFGHCKAGWVDDPTPADKCHP